jgi:hypothetical protein
LSTILVSGGDIVWPILIKFKWRPCSSNLNSTAKRQTSKRTNAASGSTWQTRCASRWKIFTTQSAKQRPSNRPSPNSKRHSPTATSPSTTRSRTSFNCKDNFCFKFSKNAATNGSCRNFNRSKRSLRDKTRKTKTSKILGTFGLPRSRRQSRNERSGPR